MHVKKTPKSTPLAQTYFMKYSNIEIIIQMI